MRSSLFARSVAMRCLDDFYDFYAFYDFYDLTKQLIDSMRYAENGDPQRKHSYDPPDTVGSYHCSCPVHLVYRYYLRPDNKDILGCFFPVTAYQSCPSEKR